MARGLKHAYASRGGRWLLAAMLACCCMGASLLLVRTTFLNNDDANIMYALAGYRTGTPYPTHRFIHVLLGLSIRSLYTALPGVPWWSVYQLFMLFVSLTVLGACMQKSAFYAGLPLWTPLALTALLYATMVCYTVSWIAFTLTAGMLGTAACALLLALDWTHDGRAARVETALGALLLLLLCFFTRNSSGCSMLCFVGAAGFYQWLKAPKGKRVTVVATALAFAAAVGIVVSVNNWGIKRYNPPEYPAFEAARGHFIDYPHAAYEEDPAFFAQLGWDKTIYDLADNLCYLDPAVNADTMEAVAQHPADAEAGGLQRVAGAFAFGERYFRGSGVSQYMLVIPVLLTLALAGLFWLCRRIGSGKAEAGVGLAVALGAFLLCFYLCYTGRFPVRTFMLIAIPTATVQTMLLIHMWGETRKNQENCEECGITKPKIGHIIPIMGALLALAAIAWSVGMTAQTLLGYDKNGLVRQNAAAEAYAMAHPQNVYLTDVTSIENIGAFTVYPVKKPVNLVDWGGTGMHSGWKDSQLAQNGLVPFTGAMFQKENVYFMTAAQSDKLHLLDAYLRSHDSFCGYSAVEDVPGGDGLVVYRFVSESGEEG